MTYRRIARHTISTAMALLVAATLAGCASKGGVFDADQYDFIDRDAKLNREDYKNMADPARRHQAEPTENKGYDGNSAPTVNMGDAPPPPIPDIAQILAAPQPPKLGENKLVSLAVTEDVPLTDVLMELARLADVDIEIGPNITGGINFRAKDKPFNEVVERIADLANLRYSMKNGVLRVERDLPYVRNYSLDFLNLVRDSQSNINISTDVLSSSGDSGGSGGSGGGSGGGGGGSGGSSGSGGGSGLTTGTTSTITGDSPSDFWSALEDSISQILNYVPGMDAGVVTASASGVPGVTPGGGQASAVPGTFYSINRQAGVLSVSATQRQHEMVQNYLTLMERNASAQVLIEAKVLEVNLDQQYQSGINWGAVLGNSNFRISNEIATTTGVNYTLDADDNNLGVELDAVAQLTEQFGTTRTLSSPRIHAINNQQAVLTFAQNRIFFEVQVESPSPILSGTQTIIPPPAYTTTRRSVPIGIILSILPSINTNTNEITLNVRPTLSRQVDSVQDPGTQLANAQIIQNGGSAADTIQNEVPVVEVRELDSIMKIKSGQVMVIGGLMEDTARNTDNGVPFADELPFIGNVFKSTDKRTLKRELIILIKATIVDTGGGAHSSDKAIFRKFTDDPRPAL